MNSPLTNIQHTGINTESISALDIYSQQLSQFGLLSEENERALGDQINQTMSALITDITRSHDGLDSLTFHIHDYLNSYKTKSGDATQRWQFDVEPSTIENIVNTMTDTLDVMLYTDEQSSHKEALQHNLAALILTLTIGRQRIIEIINNLTNLPADTERHLCRYKQLRAKLVQSNLRLVFTVALKFKSSGAPLEDLIQEGNIGLIKAADRFNFGKGFRFSTYAFWCIQNVVKTSLQKSQHLIARPSYLQEKLAPIKHARNNFLQKHERFPTAKELSKQLDIPIHTLENILNFPADPLSLNHPLTNDDDASTIEDTIALEQESVEDFIMDEQKKNLLDVLRLALSERELLVLQLRFGINCRSEHTLEEISHRLSVSIERVRQLQKNAIGKLLKMPERELAKIKAYLTLNQ